MFDELSLAKKDFKDFLDSNKTMNDTLVNMGGARLVNQYTNAHAFRIKKIRLMIDNSRGWILDEENSNEIKVDSTFIAYAFFIKNNKIFLESSLNYIIFNSSNKLIALFYNRDIKNKYEKN